MSAPPVPPTSPTSSAPLRRSRDDRVLGGVCAGIARELKVDPLLVRIATVVLTLVAGIGALAYIIAVLIIPLEGEDDPLLRKAVDGEERSLVLGLVVLGLLLWASLAGDWLPGPGGWGFGWLVLAGLGVLLWVRHDERRRRQAAASGEHAQTAAVTGGGDETAVASEAPTPVAGMPFADAEAPTETFDAAPAADEPRRPGGRIALGATLVGIGLVGTIGAIAGDGVRWDVLLACSVIAIGAVLVLAAPFGGARALIPLGFVLAAATGVAAAADLHLRGGVGERTYRPQSAAEVRTGYHLAAGRLELDLRQVDLPDGVTIVRPEIGFGELVVRVPVEARVEVDAHVSGGDIQALGREGNGLDTDVHVSPVPGSGPVLRIDARAGFGHIAIARGDERIGSRRGGPALVTFGGWR